jgi:putative flippase GtrA
MFSLVGAGGFVLQIGTIALLTRWLGWPSLIAAAAGLEIAAFHNFIGHNQLTWKEYPPRSGREWIRRYLRYQVAKTTSLGASLAVTMAVNAFTPLPLEIANTIAVVMCALPNYLITERLVFRLRAS